MTDILISLAKYGARHYDSLLRGMGPEDHVALFYSASTVGKGRSPESGRKVLPPEGKLKMQMAFWTENAVLYRY